MFWVHNAAPCIYGVYVSAVHIHRVLTPNYMHSRAVPQCIGAFNINLWNAIVVVLCLCSSCVGYALNFGMYRRRKIVLLKKVDGLRTRPVALVLREGHFLQRKKIVVRCQCLLKKVTACDIQRRNLAGGPPSILARALETCCGTWCH